MKTRNGHSRRICEPPVPSWHPHLHWIHRCNLWQIFRSLHLCKARELTWFCKRLKNKAAVVQHYTLLFQLSGGKILRQWQRSPKFCKKNQIILLVISSVVSVLTANTKIYKKSTWRSLTRKTKICLIKNTPNVNVAIVEKWKNISNKKVSLVYLVACF